MGNTVITSCLLIYMFIIFNTKWCSCNENSPSNSTLKCIPSERAALLSFKHTLTYFDKVVSSSWEGEECCKWSRVGCDNNTGYILKLDLNGNDTNNLLNTEKLDESLVYLVELKQLESLDLSCNNFSYKSVPRVMGSMKQLRYLNLSFAYFGGLVPYDLGNLTNLQVLDMEGYYYGIVVDKLRWVSGLRELRYLNMNYVNMSKAHDWMESLIGPLPYITELHLSSCGLTLYTAVHKNSSFAALLPIHYLDLSENTFSGEILPILENLTSLKHLDLSWSITLLNTDSWSPWGLVHNLCSLKLLDLSYNDLRGNLLQPLRNVSNNCRKRYALEELFIHNSNLTGDILELLGTNFRSLKSIDLSYNLLSGEIPASLGKLSNLTRLQLSHNNLSSITSSPMFPSKLEYLDISLNPLEGTIFSEPHFANLSSLTVLNMDDTMLTLNLSSDWVPPFQLQAFGAGTCKINGQFPPWLQTQKNLLELSLYNANISGLMPKWFHTMKQLDSVDLSNNKLSGSPIFPINFSEIGLSNNSLSGELLSNGSKAQVYHHANFLDLSYNFINGPLPEGLGTSMPNLGYLTLSNNQIEGPIPDTLCQILSFEILDIQNNSLSNVIPNCLANISSLFLLNLSYNKLKGQIPCFNKRDFKRDFNEVYEPSDGLYLHLNDNMFSGEIPSCLGDLNNLTILDIGGNQLSGEMFKWFSAENFRQLQILRLRGNKFNGTIPKQICSLPQLQIMDLGHNRFTGYIPPCLSNLIAMTSPNASINSVAYLNDVSEVVQGIERAYTSTLEYLVDIDLSCNNLMGSIPDDIIRISGLLSLNLSYNQLSGTIPVNIGGMKSLVSLDFSNNKLRGTIPSSMSELYRLSRLNLSYNNLSGPIPTGNQLQTLSDQASIYAGNQYLCSDFLPKKCKSKVDEQVKGRSNKGKGDNKEKLVKMEFGLVVMSGFATGFWGVVGGLVVNRRWRNAVFQRIEDGYNWLYVVVAVSVAKARMNNRI